MGVHLLEWVRTNWNYLGVMTSPASKKKKVSARELDVSNATRGIWLVKVPNYLAGAWKDATPDSELGKIKLIP